MVSFNDHIFTICYNHFVLLKLGRKGPLYRRVYEALREKILSGELAAGAPLPGTRTLARDLGVSRIVALAAFEQLMAEGYIEASVGSGSRVARMGANDALSVPRKRTTGAHHAVSKYAQRAQQLGPHAPQEKHETSGVIDFRYTTTLPDAHTIALWRQAVARAAAHPELDYPDPAGLPSLRRLLAAHLREQRGVVAEADDIVIVSGAQQAIDLAARVLCDEGTRVGIEDPSYQGTRNAFLAAGAKVIPCAIDDEGLIVDRLPALRGVCVTPSHQFPTGIIMSVARRLALLRWADARRAWILEDDYDCEFRYGVGAIPALQGLDERGRVIYIGTFARMLFPSLRLGYIVAPRSLREAFRSVKWLADRGTPPLEQQAIASLLESGAYESTRRRRVRALTLNRDAMVEAIHTHLDAREVVATGAASGTHIFLRLRHVRADATDALVRRARARGVRVYSALPYFARKPRHAALILGYTTVAPEEIVRGIERLATALRG